MPLRQLISSDEATPATHQHTGPCSDCPWSRKALNGWLGGATSDQWIRAAHSDALIECHTKTGAQCAGAAIYRANVCKSVRPPLLTLPRNKDLVFAWPTEFHEHHAKLPERFRQTG